VQERGGPRPFDVATRGLIEADPAGWLAWLGLPFDGPVHAVDSDVSAVLAAVDKVLRVEGASPWLAHLEFQVSRDRDLPLRLHEYNAILRYRHRIRVRTTVVLLRRQADGRELTGHLQDIEDDGEEILSFKYRVVRLWERPVDELLHESVGVLPLAPLAAFGPERLPEILDHLGERFERESPSAVGDLWAATALLMGVRYDRDQITDLIQRVRRMRESVTYQIILEEGREEGREAGREEGREEGELHGRVREARDLVVQFGTEQFGPPDPAVLARLNAIEDRARLESLIRATFSTTSWQELLADGRP
jgi:predicted transposase YdaD